MDRKSHKRFGTPEPSCLSKPFGRDKMLNARRLRALLCPVSSAWLHPPSLKTHVPSARQTPSEEADSLPPPQDLTVLHPAFPPNAPQHHHQELPFPSRLSHFRIISAASTELPPPTSQRAFPSGPLSGPLSVSPPAPSRLSPSICLSLSISRKASTVCTRNY